MRLKSLVIGVLVLNCGVLLSECHDPAGLGLLSPLIPIAAITGHSGIITYALTGVALLKLKAAAILASHLIKRKRAQGWGRGEGWRRRRSIQENEREEYLGVEEPSLDDVLEFDQLGCGLRLVCELSALPSPTLMTDEKLILDLFARDKNSLRKEETSRGKVSYTYAVLLGSESKDVKLCSNVYNRCPYDAKEIMLTLREANI